MIVVKVDKRCNVKRKKQWMTRFLYTRIKRRNIFCISVSHDIWWRTTCTCRAKANISRNHDWLLVWLVSIHGFYAECLVYPKQYGAETAVKHRRQLAFFRILEFGYSKLDFHSDQQETYSFCSHYINTFSSHVDASISIGWNKCQENQLLVTLSRFCAHS